MSAPCPFCGDEREPEHDSTRGMGPPMFHYYSCQSCFASSPHSATKKGAITLWNNREAPGSSEVWRKQFEKIL